MENFTSWQKNCAHEACRMSLEAVKEWLPTAAKMRKPGGTEEEVITDDLRVDLLQKIDSALETLSTLKPNDFNIQDMFKAGHCEAVFGCVEFYGEYIHSMLGFIGHMYRLSYEEKFGVLPDELKDTEEKLES
jgi:hypothetical protein